MLIGLAGFKRSGKDSTANILAAEFGFETRVAFADALRELAYGADPYIYVGDAPAVLDTLDGTEFSGQTYVRYADLIEELGYEAAKEAEDFRLFLQHLGTQGVRQVFGAEAFVAALDVKLHEVATWNPGAIIASNVVVTDVRFPNEAQYIHDRGGEVWRITRPGFGGSDTHESERHIPTLDADLDIVATNLDELADLVRIAAGNRGLG